MSERKIVAYRLEPVFEIEPGGIATAAVIRCIATGEYLSGMGGGGDYLAPGVVETLRGGDCVIIKGADPREEELDRLRAALAPVMHWYDGEPADGDDRKPRELVDILIDVVSDLQSDRAGALAMYAALQPFAACMEYIRDDESDEEWAKFRLIIKNYRDAAAARDGYGGEQADV